MDEMNGGMVGQGGEMVPCPMCQGHGVVSPEQAEQMMPEPQGQDPAAALAAAMAKPKGMMQGR